LECANREMSGELDRTRMHLEDSLGEKNEMQAEILRLQDELGGVSSRASHLEDELVRVTRRIREAMQVLQVHQTQEGSASEHGERPDESVDSVDGTVLETPPVSIRVAS
jgi:chromosome segregation ATPase